MKYKLALIAATTLLVLTIQLKAQDIPKQKYQQNQPIEDELGYTHAIKTGNTLYISGTTATGSMAAQVASIMDNIQGSLRHYGASLKNVVKETVYTTSLDSFMAVRSLHKSFYHGDYPASTWVEVKRLLLPQFLVEIEVTAVLPE